MQDVNFWGYVYSAKYALQHLKETNGQIVVNDSIAEYVPQPNLSLYNVSAVLFVDARVLGLCLLSTPFEDPSRGF